MVWQEFIRDDNFIPVLTICLSFVLVSFMLLGGMLIGFAKVMRGGAGKQNKERDAVETREFQEMQRGFSRMEQRIEALETLMLDAHKESAEPWRS